MYKDFYYKNYASLNEAMRIHNKIMPGEKFNYIDYGLLSLIRSFYDSKKDFYMTNDQLAAMFFVCDKTIRKSINRLCKCQFIKKQYKDNNEGPCGACLRAGTRQERHACNACAA